MIKTLYVVSRVFGMGLAPCSSIAIFGTPDEGVNMTKSQLNITAFVSLLTRKVNPAQLEIQHST